MCTIKNNLNTVVARQPISSPAAHANYCDVTPTFFYLTPTKEGGKVLLCLWQDKAAMEDKDSSIGEDLNVLEKLESEEREKVSLMQLGRPTLLTCLFFSLSLCTE